MTQTRFGGSAGLLQRLRPVRIDVADLKDVAQEVLPALSTSRLRLHLLQRSGAGSLVVLEVDDRDRVHRAAVQRLTDRRRQLRALRAGQPVRHQHLGPGRAARERAHRVPRGRRRAQGVTVWISAASRPVGPVPAAFLAAHPPGVIRRPDRSGSWLTVDGEPGDAIVSQDDGRAAQAASDGRTGSVLDTVRKRRSPT